VCTLYINEGITYGFAARRSFVTEGPFIVAAHSILNSYLSLFCLQLFTYFFD